MPPCAGPVVQSIADVRGASSVDRVHRVAGQRDVDDLEGAVADHQPRWVTGGVAGETEPRKEAAIADAEWERHLDVAAPVRAAWRRPCTHSHLRFRRPQLQQQYQQLSRRRNSYCRRNHPLDSSQQ